MASCCAPAPVPAPAEASPALDVVLVTGASGLVGRALRAVVEAEQAASAVAAAPPARWVWASSKDADLCDAASTAALFERTRPSHVIHLAAHVGGLFANMADNLGFFQRNCAMNDNVLRECHKHGVTKLVSCLSTCIFPDKTSYPIDEGMIHNGAPHASNEGYSYAKRMLEVQSRLYRAAHGLDAVCVIPTNVYGPHDNFSLADSHVIPGLLHRCALAKASGEPFVVSGSGAPRRQFIFAADLATLILATLRCYSAPEPLILAPDEADEVTIGDVARAVAAAMRFEGELRFDASRADGQPRKTAANGRLRALLADGSLRAGGDVKAFTFTPLAEGLAATAAWFEANYPNVRK